MSLTYGILGFLSYGSMTGYDLAKAFGCSVNFFWNAQTSQIYRELGRMEGEGLAADAAAQQEALFYHGEGSGKLSGMALVSRGDGPSDEKCLFDENFLFGFPDAKGEYPDAAGLPASAA